MVIVFLFVISPAFAQDNQTSELTDFCDIDSTLSQNNFPYLTFAEDIPFSSPNLSLNGSDFKEGQVVNLTNGEYHYEGYYCSLKDVSIIGEDYDKTVIEFDNITITSNNVLLKNLTIIGASFRNQGGFTAENVVFKNGCGQLVGEFPKCYGGCIYSPNTNSYATNVISLRNCSFIENNAQYGGAVYVGGGYLEIENCLFLNNCALQYGGAIAIEKARKVTISKSNFINDNSIENAGGAIYAVNSNLNADHVNISNCSSTFGSAISALDSNVNVTSCHFENNIAKFDGGAIYQMYGQCLLSNSSFIRNSAKNGAALFLDDLRVSSIVFSDFIENNASNCAGAIYSLSISNISYANNTFSFNVAKDYNDTFNTTLINQLFADFNSAQFENTVQNYTVLPRHYDLRDHGYVTPVKDQEDAGICWAFSIIASLETSLLKASNTSYDLSEGNVKNLMAMFSDFGWNKKVNGGGNDDMAIGYLVGWLGPVLESQDVTNGKNAISPLLNSLVHIQDVIFIKRNDYLDNDGIKRAILNYGGVVTGMLYSSEYLSDCSYYYSGSSYTDHSVVIVGWDDDYSKYNFARTPRGNGAFIVRNSWGDEWADDGYFYVSYYDTRLAQVGEEDVSYVFPLSGNINYEKNYQYDVSGKTDYIYSGKKDVWYENIFTATDDEYLAAVSTYFHTSTNWTVYVYVNDTLKSTKSGRSECGYHTVNLGDLISLHKGDVFKVVFKVSTKRMTEVPVSQANYFNKLSFTNGISFISFDGKQWQDVYDYEFSEFDDPYGPKVACIKAFTISYKLNSTLKLTIVEKGTDSVIVDALVYDSYGNPLNTGNVTFNIGNQIYLVKVENGFARINHTFEGNGKYNISAAFNGENYFSSNSSFEVLMDSFLEAAINNTIYGEKIILSSRLLDSNGFLLNDELYLAISDKSYCISKANGDFIVPELFDAGEYSAVVSCGKDNRTINFTVSKKESYLNFDVNVDGRTAIVNIHMNEDITGSIAVNMSNERYCVNVSSGVGNISFYGLANGIYEICAEFGGNNNYFEGWNSSFFTVNKTKEDPKLSISIDDIEEGENALIHISILENATDNLTVSIGSDEFIVKSPFNNYTVSNLVGGKYDVKVYFSGNDDYFASENSSTFEVKPVISKITASSKTVVYSGGLTFLVKVYNGLGKLCANQKVIFKIDGKTFKSTKTNSNGVASFKITQNPGKYKVSIHALNKVAVKTLNVRHILNLKSIQIKKSSKRLILQASLAKINGKHLKNKNIIFKFNNRKYVAKTNSKGIAKVIIKQNIFKGLKIGKKVTYQATYLKDTVKRVGIVKK